MRLIVALKAFWKAFRNPNQAQHFLEDKKDPQIETKGDASHLRLLALLQHSGRLIDFLKEDIGSYSDVQIGSAVRQIQKECAKTLEELVTIRPLFDEKEGEEILVQVGYDPAQIKVVGKVKGEPPFKGVLVHKGWKAHKRSLPKQTTHQQNDIISPAEVEVR